MPFKRGSPRPVYNLTDVYQLQLPVRRRRRHEETMVYATKINIMDIILTSPPSEVLSRRGGSLHPGTIAPRLVLRMGTYRTLQNARAWIPPKSWFRLRRIQPRPEESRYFEQAREP